MAKTQVTNIAPAGRIREVPVKQEVWTRTPAQELIDPPKFPVLK